MTTRDRPEGDVPAFGDQVAVRTGDAVEFIREARHLLGYRTNDRTIRELVKAGELTATQDGIGTWRSINVASLEAYRKRLEEQIEEHAAAAAALRRTKESDAQ